MTTDGFWLTLPRSGWGAVVAAAAPTGAVRRGASPSEQAVRETRISRGESVTTVRSATAAELDSVTADIADYLDRAGVEDLDAAATWEVFLPAGVTEARFWAQVNSCQHGHDVAEDRTRLEHLLASLLG